jgi:hypothetical protein
MQAEPKPEGDKYGFTHFAHKLNSSEGVNPLPSDSRRRKDRHALQVCQESMYQHAPLQGHIWYQSFMLLLSPCPSYQGLAAS